MAIRSLVALLGGAVLLQACGLVARFGPDKELASSSDGGAGGGDLPGVGGATGAGGSGGATLAYFCDSGSAMTWLRSFGDASVEGVKAIAPAPQGGLYATGSFEGEIDFGAGPIVSEGSRDLFVTRFDAQGQLLWANRYGNNLWDDGTPTPARHKKGVALLGNAKEPLDLGGGEHTPFGPSDAFVTLLSPAGEHLWTTWLGGGGSAYGLALTVDPATDDIIVFTAFSGQLDFDGTFWDSNNGSNDVVLVRLDGDDGTILDSHAFGGPAGDWAQAVAVGADGTVFVVGSSTGSVDFGQGPQPSDGEDGYAAAFTKDFELLWGRQYVGNGDQHYEDMALAPDGNLVAVGKMKAGGGAIDLGGKTFPGELDAYVVRISSANGDVLDGRMILGIDEPRGIDVDAQGRVIVAGQYRFTLNLGGETFDSVEGAGDPFLFALSSDLEDFVWRHVPVGSYQSEGFTDVAIADDGAILASGTFYHDLIFEGCGQRQSAGDADALLLKRAP